MQLCLVGTNRMLSFITNEIKRVNDFDSDANTFMRPSENLDYFN